MMNASKTNLSNHGNRCGENSKREMRHMYRNVVRLKRLVCLSLPYNVLDAQHLLM